MRFRVLLLMSLILPVLSYAQANTQRTKPSLESFEADQSSSDIRFTMVDDVVFPEDEFNRKMVEKHYELFTEAECDNVPVNLKATTHKVSLVQLDTGEYKFSFSVMFYDKNGETLDYMSEAYFNGVVIPEATQFKAETIKTIAFKDYDMVAVIDTRGVYSLSITFGSKPLYGLFSELEFVAQH